MNTRECPSIAESLASYVDDEVTPAERRAIEAHLETCPVCRRRASDLRRLELLVRVAFAEGPEVREEERQALARAKWRVAAHRRSGRRMPVAWQRFIGHPMRALAAMIVLSVAVGGTLNLLGFADEGMQVLSYILSFSLS
jgi:anti-sigma factor RsiW